MAASMAAPSLRNMTSSTPSNGKLAYKDRQKPTDIRFSNIQAGKSVADAIRTSLGPRGMDKMIQAGRGEVTITNDGATILKQMKVLHPAAQMLVELSQAQDVEAGDGTTSVVVVAGALLEAAAKLLERGLHPMVISEAFQHAAEVSVNILKNMSVAVDLKDRASLIKIAKTSLNSKVVSQFSDQLAPIAVDAVLRVVDPAQPTIVDLKDIKIIQTLGATVDESELVDGLVLTQTSKGPPDAPRRVEKAKIGLVQFCLSPPKTDMENTVIISDYTQMDRILREERAYLLNIVKQIKKANCNVLLIQKSILRDAVSDMALHYLAKMKIMVLKDIERDEVEFIAKTIGLRPIASLDHFLPEHLASADLVEQFDSGTTKLVKISGIAKRGRTVSIIAKGSNKMVLEEAERSLHDALCVIRCLVRERHLIVGGGAPEIELSLRLAEYSRTLVGAQAICVRMFGEALEVIPCTLAENAGLSPIDTVTELRNRHAAGDVQSGINVKKGSVSNIFEENVVQPLLVTTSCIQLASETVRSILKIDDIVNGRG